MIEQFIVANGSFRLPHRRAAMGGEAIQRPDLRQHTQFVLVELRARREIGKRRERFLGSLLQHSEHPIAMQALHLAQAEAQGIIRFDRRFPSRAQDANGPHRHAVAPGVLDQ